MTRLATLIVLIAITTSAHAGDWPHWRGPNYDGSAEAKNLPTDFSKTKNVKWAATMPGPSEGTPIVFGDQVFVSSVDIKHQKLMAIALNRNTGKDTWRRVAGTGYQPQGHGTPISIHKNSTYAAPSPVTDGNVVVFFYGNGDLVACEMDGKFRWTRNLQKEYGDFTYQWTYSASPTIYDGRIYVQVLQRDEVVHGRGKAGAESYVLAINPKDGKTIWKHIRPSKANKESLESFSTPIPFEQNGRREIIIKGGDVLTGHDPATGKELWRWGTWNPGHREVWWRVVPTPVVGAGLVLACAPKNAPVFAISLGGKGDVSSSALRWKSEKRSPLTSDVPTPLFYRGKFYVLSDKKKSISRVNPADGKVEWTTKMPGRYLWRASPTGADGKIWCINHGGQVVILNPSDGKIINSVAMGAEGADRIRSSIVVANDHLYIRTNSKLYCVGK